jgi:hypothetical protein
MIRLSALAGAALALLGAQPAIAACSFGDLSLYPNQMNHLQIVVRSGTSCPLRLVGSGGPMSDVAITQRPAHGSVSLQAQAVIYTARAGYVGADSFAYVRSGLDHLNKPVRFAAQVAVRVVP